MLGEVLRVQGLTGAWNMLFFWHLKKVQVVSEVDFFEKSNHFFCNVNMLGHGFHHKQLAVSEILLVKLKYALPFSAVQDGNFW